MLPLLLRVALSLPASWHLPRLSPSRVVAAIAAVGGTVAALAALLAPSAPSPGARGSAADSAVDSARPLASHDPDVYLGWADVPEWRPLRSPVDDLPDRRRRHTRTAPNRRAPTATERQKEEPQRTTPPADPDREAGFDRKLGRLAAPPAALPDVELALAGPHVTARAARAATPERAAEPTPGAEVSPEPAARSEPPPSHTPVPVSPPMTVGRAVPRSPTPNWPANGPLVLRADTPRPPATAPPAGAPVLGEPGSESEPFAPRAASGPSPSPGALAFAPGAVSPLMSDLAFGKDFGSDIDDIVFAAAKEADQEAVDLFTRPASPDDGPGRADELLDALRADAFDSGLGRASDIFAPFGTIAFDVPGSSGGDPLAPDVDVRDGDELQTKTVLRPMAIAMVPEPSTALLLALGLAALAVGRRREMR